MSIKKKLTVAIDYVGDGSSTAFSFNLLTDCVALNPPEGPSNTAAYISPQFQFALSNLPSSIGNGRTRANYAVNSLTLGLAGTISCTFSPTPTSTPDTLFVDLYF